jgi:hypothetical protein
MEDRKDIRKNQPWNIGKKLKNNFERVRQGICPAFSILKQIKRESN